MTPAAAPGDAGRMDEGPDIVPGANEHVAFLDGAGLDARALCSRIEEVLAEMPRGSVLSVHSDDSTSRLAVRDWCARSDNELHVVIRHDERRTSFTIEHGSHRGGPAPR
jgi:TusA-related sulfurtransferase